MHRKKVADVESVKTRQGWVRDVLVSFEFALQGRGVCRLNARRPSDQVNKCPARDATLVKLSRLPDEPPGSSGSYNSILTGTLNRRTHVRITVGGATGFVASLSQILGGAINKQLWHRPGSLWL